MSTCTSPLFTNPGSFAEIGMIQKRENHMQQVIGEIHSDLYIFHFQDITIISFTVFHNAGIKTTLLATTHQCKCITESLTVGSKRIVNEVIVSIFIRRTAFPCIRRKVPLLEIGVELGALVAQIAALDAACDGAVRARGGAALAGPRDQCLGARLHRRHRESVIVTVVVSVVVSESSSSNAGNDVVFGNVLFLHEV
ncbi:hypothetical protein V8G54_035393 [Vigna mungo]|uniref:Uncharacterized protein n=1 Tax=Vigna mungo TaxID=3915 RepID=A0AAQ3MGI2_VIGMU